MRDLNDIIRVRFQVSATAELDRERVELDPMWDVVSSKYDLGSPEQQKAALADYVCHYLSREILLEETPMTNGPAALTGIQCEVVEGANNG